MSGISTANHGASWKKHKHIMKNCMPIWFESVKRSKGFIYTESKGVCNSEPWYIFTPQRFEVIREANLEYK